MADVPAILRISYDIILNPSFDPNTLEYNFDTHKVNIEITAIPNNKYAKVDISND